jgi:uncharacterized repeat protein (TIGR03803 family)
VNDGKVPVEPLIVGPDGYLYGVTEFGGANSGGVAYKLNPVNHKVTIVHAFSGSGLNYPYSLLLGQDGNFYGVAGGNSRTAIFKMTPAGRVTTLNTFTNSPINLSLMQASDGNFYGTTQLADTGANRYGVVFKMTGTPPSMTVTILHSFGQGNDGRFPDGPLVLAPNGNLYGETEAGGTGPDIDGDGTIYEISTDGSTYTVVHNFNDGSIPNDGSEPEGGLTLGPDNNLYGATFAGGAYGPEPSIRLGTLFRVTP